MPQDRERFPRRRTLHVAPVRPDPADPARMTGAERVREVAVLLARAVLRMRVRRRPDALPAPESVSDFAEIGLEVRRDSRPYGDNAVNAP